MLEIIFNLVVEESEFFKDWFNIADVIICFACLIMMGSNMKISIFFQEKLRKSIKTRRLNNLLTAVEIPFILSPSSKQNFSSKNTQEYFETMNMGLRERAKN